MTFHELSRFYQNFAALDHAGITYLKTFESMKRNERNTERRYQLQFLIDHLKKNRTLSEGLRFIRFVPVFDIPLIKAAEESGKMVEVFKALSQKYAEAWRAEKEVRGRLFQPYFTMVVALFVPTFPDYFANKITLLAYLKGSFGGLVVVSGALYGFYYVWQKSYYEFKMAFRFHQILSWMPFFRGLAKKISIEKFSSALAMMLDSGMDLFESLRQAALCAADPEMKRSIDQAIPIIRQGVDITKVFQTIPYFPPDLVNAISMGAESGKLPEFLKRYGEALKTEIEGRVKMMTKIIPIAMSFLVMAYSLSILIEMYQGHINEINQVLGE